MVRDILDPLLKSRETKAFVDFREEIHDKEEEYRERPALNLEAMASEQANQIYKVATKSGELKGSLTKEAKDAAAKMCAAVTVLAMRAQNPTDASMGKQLAEMRAEMDKLRRENSLLKTAITRLQQREGKRKKEEPPPRERVG